MIEPVQSETELLDLLKLNGGPDLAICKSQIGSDFSAKSWIENPWNVALRIENDLAMFEHAGPQAYEGHIWFQSRGRKAFNRAEAMLCYMKSSGASKIIGEVPCWRREVQRFVRKLGFVAIGMADRPVGKVVVHQLVF